MKTIKIKYVGFWPDFDEKNNWITNTLQKHFDVDVCNNPDYIFCSIHDKNYSFCDYPQVRIMIEGEPYIPDLNLVDYGICTYPITMGDRLFSIQCGIESLIRGNGRFLALDNKIRHCSVNDIRQKEYFTGYVVSHEFQNSLRETFYYELSKYKTITSAGSYRNNMEDGRIVDFRDNSKTDFFRKCKFAICFESIKHNGFMSEKIEDAFYSDTIPIYLGSDFLDVIYNTKAFIRCNGLDDIKNAIDRIIRLDNDDAEYLKMINENIFLKEHYPSIALRGLEDFLCHIFDQPKDKAFRRCRESFPHYMNDRIIELKRLNSLYHTDEILHQYPRKKLIQEIAHRTFLKPRCK